MKAKRQALIREIVESQSIQTQEELAEALRAHGMVVTQATVSRDIKEMHLLKVLAEDGNYRSGHLSLSAAGDSGPLGGSQSPPGLAVRGHGQPHRLCGLYSHPHPGS